VAVATWTHIAAPIEYLLELQRRGHRVTWQQPRELVSRFFASEEERLSLPFNFSLVELNYSSVDEAVQLMTERPWMEVLDQLARLSYESVYPTAHRAMMAAVEQDRPDIVLCDSVADHCVDITAQLKLPAVIAHCTTLMDQYQPMPHFDLPSSATPYSHRWHEQPLWHRLYNTFGVLPQLAWSGIATALRAAEMKRALGAPISDTGIASFRGREVLYDSSWAWEWPLYWPPYLHMVGPIPKTWRKRHSRQIDPHQQRWLDDSVAAGVPVVYVAMGSIAKLTDEWLRKFATAFSSCPALPVGVSAPNQTTPFRVLWATRRTPSWLTDLLPPSVRVEQWVNQPAVLEHPAVHLFLSHGGMSSSQEAIAVGLPILALPLFVDQPPLAARLQDRGVAEVLDKMTFTADEMCAAMRRLVFDPQVRVSADMLQRLYHKSDSGGVQRAVDVIERAAVSTDHLIPYRERQEVSWVVRYNVDVYAIGLAVLVAVLVAMCVVAWLVLRSVLRLMEGRRTKSKLA